MADDAQTTAREVLESPPKDSRIPTIDAPRILFDSTQKWFWDAGNVLVRGLAFYLALMAAVVGYVLTRSLPPNLLHLVLTLALVTSILFLLGWAACASVMFRCIDVLEKLRNLFVEDPALKPLKLSDVLFASRRAIKAITVGIYIVVLSFIAAIVVLWRSFPIENS